MRTIVIVGVSALAWASLGAIAAAPANAASSFGFSFWTGPVYDGYYDGYYDSPCYRPYPYRPYYCVRYAAPYAYGYAPWPYYGGDYRDGGYYRGGYRYTYRDRHRDENRDHDRRR